MGMRGILAALSLAWTGAAFAEAPVAEPTLLELSLLAREARMAGDHAAWLKHGQATLARAPDHPDLLISVSRALAANDRPDEALDLLDEAIRRGARVDAKALPEYEALRNRGRFHALAARGLANRRPVSPPEEFLVVEDTTIDTEGIAYDEDTARLFIGSLRGGIWQVDLEGNMEAFAGTESGLREVFGLKVDRERRLLWAATSVLPGPIAAEPKKDAGLSGVFAFNLDDGSRVRDCWLDERPVEHGFNDLALAANGDLYVSDSAANAIYRLPPDECRFERVIHDPRMSFPNGIVLSSDDSKLYVAHIEGLSVIDLASGRRTPLAVPGDAAVNSIDGLVRDGNDLLGVQPSASLARVLRIRLEEGGAAIREVVTVSSPPPDGLSQTTGVVVGAHYYSVAGVIDPEVEDRRARILRANLR